MIIGLNKRNAKIFQFQCLTGRPFVFEGVRFQNSKCIQYNMMLVLNKIDT